MSEKLKIQLEKDLADLDEQYLKDIQEARNKYIGASESWKLEIQLQVIKDSYETMKQVLIKTSTGVQNAYNSAVEAVEDIYTKAPLFKGSDDVKKNVLDALKRVSGN